MKNKINQLKKEVEEILRPCINCGMCKAICPIFKVLNEEYYSPRGKVNLIKSEVFNEIIFKCNLCRACEEKCPLNVKICDAIRKTREIMVLEGKGLKGNKEMIKNIEKYGDPFGKFDGKSKKLYCC